MKVGIIGCGNIAKNHARAILGLKHTISAVLDNNISNAERFAIEHKAEFFSDNASEFFKQDFDVLHILTPANTHFELIKSAILKNVHIFCEKPLMLFDEEVDEVTQLLSNYRKQFGVNFNVRFHTPIDVLKSKIASPDFGSVNLIFGSYLQEFHSLPAPDGWRYNEILAGKMRAVSEIGSHFFDLAEYVSRKKVTAVSANFGCFNKERIVFEGNHYTKSQFDELANSIAKNNESEKTRIFNEAKTIYVQSEDAATINFKFDGGLGACVLSEVSAGRINRLSIEVCGENQNAFWNSEENNTLNIATAKQGINTMQFPFGGGFDESFNNSIGSFYDSTNGKINAAASFYDGARNVKILNAIYKSAKNNGAWTEISY